ncbi:MAG: TolC family protein, partial [Anaerolineae bacterium]|nr:TolC family protein [Gemmatimonadaceae bacterium]
MSSTKNQYSGRGAARTIATVFAVTILIASETRAQVAPAAQSAVQSRAISLDEAVRTAEAQSEAIRIARAGVQRAQGQQYQARSQRLPQLNASASYTRTLASQFENIGGGGPAV